MLLDEKFMKAAEDAAKKSPCIRRKYGVIISSKNYTDTQWFTQSVGYNLRQGRCCSDICIRDRMQANHAQGIERGAEIHAEMIALLDYETSYEAQFYLAAYDRHGEPLLGKNCRPCHMCAMIIKYKGFDNVIIRNDFGELEAISIDQIIEDHEASYEPISIL